MGELDRSRLASVGLDAVALKPTEHRLDRARDLPLDVVVDFEGREHVPDADAVGRLATTHDVRVTVPVRADGFDPLGDDAALAALPADVRTVLVAGNGAYLASHERDRAIAPRLRAAAERCRDPWIGTEGVERLALAVGGTQFDLLSPATEREVRALRAAGLQCEIALYAPIALTDDEDFILDALGEYAARRESVRERLSADDPTDSAATGHARETLLEACRGYAIVGDGQTVRERIARLRDAGIDAVVGYPALGLDTLASR